MKDEKNIANSLIEEMHKIEESTKIEDINLSLSYGIVKGIKLCINRIKRCNPQNTDSCIDFP